MRKHVIEKDVVSVVADFDFQALLSKAMFLHHRDVPITITILQKDYYTHIVISLN